VNNQEVIERLSRNFEKWSGNLQEIFTKYDQEEQATIVGH